MNAKPFFIVSSGRSGTAMMVKALASAEGVAIEHEYMVHLVQPLAVKRYQGLASAEDARAILRSTHGAALRYASTPVWGDSSNKLSWLIPDLAALFPQARFVHLVRDGRKVASSYFYKLFAECYDDRSSTILAAYLAAPNSIPAPPPEKKYWWPQPKSSEPWSEEFPWFEQFQRICWHWSEINHVILRDLESVPEKRKLFLRLEDLRAQPSLVAQLFAFLGLKYRDEHFAVFARPHNVNRPVDKMLTPEQAADFKRLCQPMMERLGYGNRAEYAVNY
ncbi:MAG TPA: sulfotransferase [Micropepsaceae bacterium]|nr:sulfotransferase [Micropepsaceae bacterium]